LISAEFEAIRQLDRRVKKYLDGVCVPFETGTRFLAVPLIEDVDRSSTSLRTNVPQSSSDSSTYIRRCAKA
jgi:hypothetical protein